MDRTKIISQIVTNSGSEDAIQTNSQTANTVNQDANTVATIESEKLKQLQLKTQRDIIKLEEAKRAAHSKSVKMQLDSEIEATKIRLEKQKREESEQAKTVGAIKNVAEIGGTVYNDAKNNIDNIGAKIGQTSHAVTSTLESIAVPGSIWLPITILLLFFFLLLPINGKTRAEWLINVIMGNAVISSSKAETNLNGKGGAETENIIIRTFTR